MESGLPKRKNRIIDKEFIDKLKEPYYANKTYKEIGIELGISAKAVYDYVRKLISLGYIEKRKVKHRTRRTKLYSIMNMYIEGVPAREIAESAGISLCAVYDNIKKAKEIGLIPLEKDGLEIRSNKRNIVRKLYRENKSVKEISNITGLHADSIYKYTRDFRKGRYYYKRLDEKTKLLILSLYQNTKSGVAVSKATGIPIRIVYKCINDANSIKYKYQLTNGESGTISSVK